MYRKIMHTSLLLALVAQAGLAFPTAWEAPPRDSSLSLGALTLSLTQMEAVYRQGREALGNRNWEKAIELFERVIADGKSQADGALYWKAYAQTKLNLSAEALTTLQTLRQSFAESSWLRDARSLETEIRQAAGQVLSPEDESRNDMKMMALAGLMHASSEEAVPILTKFLGGNNSQELKEKALFILSQHHAAEARKLMEQIGRGRIHPELQQYAIKNLALFGDKESMEALGSIYKETNDIEVKRQILQGFMISGNKKQLLAVAQSDPNAELRKAAVHSLGVIGATGELGAMYGQAADSGTKKEILQAMFIAGHKKFFLDILERESDPDLREIAIQKLGLTGSCDELGRIFKNEQDPAMKKKVINAMFLGGGCAALQEIARNEQNPEMRIEAINSLGIAGKEHAGFLEDLYRSETDPAVRKAVLHAFFLQGNGEKIGTIAESESDPELKMEAIQKLGLTGGCDRLERLYGKGADNETKMQVIKALYLAQCDSLAEKALAEKDGALQREAIKYLGLLGKDHGADLRKIYATAADLETREAVLNALYLQKAADTLIEIARTEKDPQLRKAAIQKLSLTGTKEATQFLIELLEQ